MTIKFNLTVLIIFIYMYTFFRGLYVFIKNKKVSISSEITNFQLYLSIIFIIYATLFPIRLNVSFEGFEIYNLIPLKVPFMLYRDYSFSYFIYQTFGNIALFIPFGFFVYNKTEFNIKRSIIACFMLTLFVEITQGFIPYRFCEIDDIWLNTLGGTIGSCSHYIYLKLRSTYTLPKQKSS